MTFNCVYKLKGMIQKKEDCDAGDLEKDNKKSRIPERTKMMKFNTKVKWLALDGWDPSRTLIEVKVE